MSIGALGECFISIPRLLLLDLITRLLLVRLFFIPEWMFITGVKYYGNKLFTGVNDTGD
jgi:hypothetical protein